MFTDSELAEQAELSGPESSFYRSVERKLSERVYVEGMANPYSRGTPDRYYETENGALWVEYKFIKLPVRENTLIRPCEGLSPLQRKWLQRAFDNNVNVAVIVGTSKGGAYLNNPPSWDSELPKSVFELMLVPPAALAATIEKELTK